MVSNYGKYFYFIICHKIYTLTNIFKYYRYMWFILCRGVYKLLSNLGIRLLFLDLVFEIKVQSPPDFVHL